MSLPDWNFQNGTRKNRTVLKSQATVVKIETPGTAPVGDFQSSFGMAYCTLLSNNLLLVTGVIQQNTVSTTPADPIQAYWVSCSGSSTLRIQRIGLGFDRDTGGSTEQPRFDFGSLVHHCCIPIANKKLLLVGGRVPSFVFGKYYAT